MQHYRDAARILIIINGIITKIINHLIRKLCVIRSEAVVLTRNVFIEIKDNEAAINLYDKCGYKRNSNIDYHPATK